MRIPDARPARAWLVLLAVLGVGVVPVLADPAPQLTARSAVVIDGWSGEVLYEKAARKPCAIASLTKIMTGVVVLERADLGQVISVSKEAAETGESSCNLKEGEKLTVGTLLEMALMRSGNDAAVALAIAVGGSVEGFATLMNAKAAELGLTQSRFVTPHGLDKPGHQQTPLEIAELARYALRDPRFAGIVATPSKVIPREGYKDGYKIVNTNKLLEIRSDCVGVKTGWTGQAGYCLCSAAQRDGRRFIVVVMGSDERFWESSALLDWAFDTYVERAVVGAGVPIAEVRVRGGAEASVAVAGAQTLTAAMRRDAALPSVRFEPMDVSAPVVAGQVVGTLRFEHGGETWETPAIAIHGVRVSFARELARWPNGLLLGGCFATSCGGALALRRRREIPTPRRGVPPVRVRQVARPRSHASRRGAA